MKKTENEREIEIAKGGREREGNKKRDRQTDRQT